MFHKGVIVGMKGYKMTKPAKKKSKGGFGAFLKRGSKKK